MAPTRKEKLLVTTMRVKMEIFEENPNVPYSLFEFVEVASVSE